MSLLDGLVPNAPADKLADGTAALYGTMPAGVNTLNG